MRVRAALIIGAAIWIFVFPHVLLSETTTLTVTIESLPTLSPPSSDTRGGGGGGGGGGVGPVSYNPSQGQVILHGTAYPGSTVTLVRDGQFLAQASAGGNAQFEFNLSAVTPGTYTYGIWSEDNRGIRSVTHTFTVSIAPGVGTIISGILIPPTIDIDKTEVQRGEVLTILGQASPSAEVSILIHSAKEIVKSVTASKEGIWHYPFNTLEIDYGDHDVVAREKTTSQISELSQPVNFIVSDKTVLKVAKNTQVSADLNDDKRVNIIDFSIIAYWYKRTLTSAGQNADLNHDGKVDLKDFSILAYYWTG